MHDFGDAHFYAKCLLFTAIALGAEFYSHYYGDYNPWLMLFIGFWYPIVGTSTGHEGHHGSASRYKIL